MKSYKRFSEMNYRAKALTELTKKREMLYFHLMFSNCNFEVNVFARIHIYQKQFPFLQLFPGKILTKAITQ